MKKTAFSIPEILIFMTIIGIICVFMLTLIKPNEKYVKYAYYNSYYSLSTAAYNIDQDARDMKELNEIGTPETDKVFPSTARELCKKLALDPASNAGTKESKYGYLNATIYNCGTGFKAVSKDTKATEFKEDNIAFTTTNSMRYYISEPNSVAVKDAAIDNSIVNLPYFLVWVDLNGNRGPNTTEWKESRSADIVPFVLTISGKVIPVGYPTIDKKYMQGRVRYSTDVNESYSNTRTFYETQMAAFGTREYPSMDILSIRATLATKLQDTAAEIAKQHLPKSPAVDTNCVLTNGMAAPRCIIEVDEQKGF